MYKISKSDRRKNNRNRRRREARSKKKRHKEIPVSSTEKTEIRPNGNKNNSAKYEKTCIRISSVPPIPTRISIRPEYWKDEWGIKPDECFAKDHYDLWRNVYKNELNILYNVLNNILNSYKEIDISNIDFNDFIDFAYYYSTGYIP